MNAGPVLIVVQDGTVTLNADKARVGAPPDPSLSGIEVQVEQASPAAAEDVAVQKGEQIALDGNVNAQLTNNGTTAVRLLLIVLTPSNS